MSEEVDIVNDRDRVVGHSKVSVCLEGGLLHRAVAILVVRGDGRMVLQQRSKKDLWQPGRWTLSSTGHVRRGETYGEAARRELFEELGVRAKPRKYKKYLMRPMSSGRLTEREWVMLYDAQSDAELKIDRGELEGTREVGAGELRVLLARRMLTSDAVFLLREYLKGGRPFIR